MSRLRKQIKRGAARKGSPSLDRRGLKGGDRVRIIEIPEDLKDPDCDLKDPGQPKLRTGELFRFCLGRMFTIYGFGRYGHVELQVDKSPAIRKKGFSGTIWIEPEFLKRVGYQRLKARTKTARIGTPERRALIQASEGSEVDFTREVRIRARL